MAFRVFGEPAFADAFFLFEHFAYAPEGGEGEYAEDGGEVEVLDEERGYDGDDADNEEDPPRLDAEIVFHFDDQWVEQSDAEECADADDEAVIVHNLFCG